MSDYSYDAFSNTSFILPEQLEADATVPQCLDNQYVPNDVFDLMRVMRDSGKSDGYNNPQVAQQRMRRANTEFRRSLIYSTQTVINRAFFINSPFLYENYRPGNKEGIKSFAALMRPQEDHSSPVIIPYIHKETSFGNMPQFALNDLGKKAFTALLDEVGDEAIPVRLDEDPEEDAAKALALEMKFGGYISGHLNELTKPGYEALFNEMASEVFGPKSDLLQQQNIWNEFRNQVKAVAEYVGNKSHVTRTDVYKQFLVPGPTDKEKNEQVINGIFRSGEYVFEIKKLIDLVYNTNLPDLLGRYTFTPAGMPSRQALRDFQIAAPRKIRSDLIQESGALKDDLNRIFMANVQQAMALPILSDLSMSDVVEIRSMESWRNFSTAQQAILQNPMNILDRIEGFTQSFNRFQTELSSWYFHKYQSRQKVERYANFATIALQIGGAILVGLGFPGEDAASIVVGESVPIFLPAVIKRPTLKLMAYVVDLEHKAIDPDRSYSIDLMQIQADYTRDEVRDLFKHFCATNSEDLYKDTSATEMPDQGKK